MEITDIKPEGEESRQGHKDCPRHMRPIENTHDSNFEFRIRSTPPRYAQDRFSSSKGARLHLVGTVRLISNSRLPSRAD